MWLALGLAAGSAALAGDGAADEEAQAGSAERFRLTGFASLAYLHSSGNNFLGDSRDGSFELVEAGVNGSLDLTRRLRFAAQVLARRAGVTDDGDPRLDFAFVDFALVSGRRHRFGLRAGRVKNPFGLFNETRDVLFTRPGILLPQAIYFEGQGFRDILFSGDGGQVYGDHDGAGGSNTSWVVSVMDPFEAGEQTRRDLFSDFDVPADVRFSRLAFAQVRRRSASGRWLAALGSLQSWIDFIGRGLPFRFRIESDGYTLGGQHFRESWSFTGEYSLTRTRAAIGGSGSSSEGIYVQAERRWSRTWSAFGRADFRFSDRNDRNGSEFERRTGQPAHIRFVRDLTVGVRWAPRRHWATWAEIHEVDGTASVTRAANPGVAPGDRERRWRMLLVAVGARF